MIRAKIYSPIGREDGVMYWQSGGGEEPFSLVSVQRLFAEHPSETDFAFDIHCLGGEVDEGFAIYDFLRQSGKTIHMNIAGNCHSMAVTLLLAAPKEYRTASPNATALIHEVQTGNISGGTSEVESYAREMRMMQDRMLDVYAERTGCERDRLEALMLEQREHSAKELLELGFIGKINSYNTNYSFLGMDKEKAGMLKRKANEFLGFVNGLLGTTLNFEFVDDNGDVLFTTEGRDDTLEVGLPASPDGEFVIADGRTVVIAEGVVTEIREPEAEEEEEPAPESEETETEAKLREENEKLREALRQATDVVNELKKEVYSNFMPPRRQGNTRGRQQQVQSREERMEALKAKFNNKKRGE